MFSFFKKKPELSNLNRFISIDQDMHSHILPGIDDGAPDLATSMELVKGLYALGIRKTIATPHVIGDMFRNSPETILPALKILQDEVAREGMDLKISAAAEYMMDDYFLSLLKGKQPLLPIDKNIILTEFSYAIPPSNSDEISFEIFTAGYQPILAHPERYSYFHGKKYKQYHDLKDMGFLFQVNLLSVTGYYGIPVAKAARYLLDNGMVDHVGTDMHHVRHLEALKGNLAIIHEAIGEGKYNEFGN